MQPDNPPCAGGTHPERHHNRSTGKCYTYAARIQCGCEGFRKAEADGE